MDNSLVCMHFNLLDSKATLQNDDVQDFVPEVWTTA